MISLLLFVVPILAAALATPLSWQIVHSFYLSRPSEISQTSTPIQQATLKSLHGLGTWFALWMLATVLLSGFLSLLGPFAAPALIALALCLLLFRTNLELFWLSFLLGTAALEVLMLFLQNVAGLDLSLQGYTPFAQIANPFYPNPFFIAAVAITTLATLFAASKRTAQQGPTEQEHLIPPSLPDPTPPPR